jgi:molecular chaperone DnaK
VIQNSTQNHPVGIDLGTTESVLAYVDNDGEVITWKPENGSALHASAVLAGSRVHVGDEAIRLAGRANEVLFEGFKRDMGKSRCETTANGVEVPPEILSGFVLQHLKERAESDLGLVRDVVVSVPAYFDAKRRLATQEAGRLAGLNVVAIINEPTAASIGYGYSMGYLDTNKPKGAQNILVYDFGGGTFDVTLLRYDEDRFQTLATDGDVRLGGIDLDSRLADYLADKFHARTGLHPHSSDLGKKNFLAIANEVKHGLTHEQEYVANLSFGGKSTSELILREEFNGLIEPYIERTLATCDDLLYEAGSMQWTEINTILLVGGSSQIPFISQRLESLTGITPTSIGNPQELVAKGCALYAANLSEDHQLNFDITNVNSHSLGIRGRDVETGKPMNRILVPRNSTLPRTVTKKFVTFKRNQRSVKLILLEGESENPDLCYEVGKFRVELNPGVEKGEKIVVFCSYNNDGTIHVRGKLANDDGASASLEISRNLDKFESLEEWRKRLSTSQKSASESFFGDADYENEDIAAAMKDLDELDGIFLKIGQKARSRALPEVLAGQQRYARKLEHQIRQIEPLVEQLGMEVAGTVDHRQRQKLRASISVLKNLENQHHRAFRQVIISLGRSCYANGVLTDAADASPDQVKYLEKAIEQIWD